MPTKRLHQKLCQHRYMPTSCLSAGCKANVPILLPFLFTHIHPFYRHLCIQLQKSGHGRINFLQFKTFIANLKAWQGVFKMYSKEKAGILRAERLRDALYDVGFQLSSDIMSIIMLKYMRKDGTLRLGDFTSAILHLTTAFGKAYYSSG